MMQRTPRALMMVAAMAGAGLMAGCSTTAGKNAQYDAAPKRVNTLEVPPDLITPAKDDRYAVPGAAKAAGATPSLADYDAARKAQPQTAEQVLPAPGRAEMVRDGNERWLRVTGTPEQLWPELRAFWLDNNLAVTVDNPKLGVMETDWAEDRSKIPMDPIRAVISKVTDVLYSPGLLDKYRLRIDPSNQPGKVDIFISHRGLEEDNKQNDVGTIWVWRPSDPLLEAEMLTRLQARLNDDEKLAATAAQKVSKEAPAPDRAHIVETGGNVTLQVDSAYDRAWRQVGVSLDRVGLVVEDRDSVKGVYHVRYVVLDDPKTKPAPSLWSKLAFWKSDKQDPSTASYQVAVKADGKDRTTVTILSKDGEQLASNSARQMLTLLYNDLK